MSADSRRGGAATAAARIAARGTEGDPGVPGPLAEARDAETGDAETGDAEAGDAETGDAAEERETTPTTGRATRPP
ncbi:hypothetical protein [Streptomyces sp. NPDC096323]|uniref:hypothetical protein n=1 Tax=Streptomyces sp. NPDC096323 TaxID=3155822 RepID=UPI003332876F